MAVLRSENTFALMVELLAIFYCPTFSWWATPNITLVILFQEFVDLALCFWREWQFFGHQPA